MKANDSFDLLKVPSRAPHAIHKEETLRETERIRQELLGLQNRLYAENKRSVLVVLQGLSR